MRNLLLTLVGLAMGAAASAQILDPVSWSNAAKKTSAREAAVYLKAQVASGWHIYAQNIPKGKNLSTSFDFYPSNDYRLIGTTAQPKPINRYEKGLGLMISYFERSAVFMQKIKLKNIAPTAIYGEVTYMACDASRCLPPETVSFNIPVK